MPPKGWKKSTIDLIEGDISMSDVRTMWAYISKNNVTVKDENRFSAKDLSAFIKEEFLDKGYSLFHAEKLDVNDVAIGVLYVFTK